MSVVAWCATAASLIGTLLLSANIKNSCWAYPIMLLGSVLWYVLAYIHHDTPQVALWGVYSLINCFGIWRWIVLGKS